MLIMFVIYCNFFKEIWSFSERVVLNMLTKLTLIKKEVGQMLTLADKGGRGGWGNADNG